MTNSEINEYISQLKKMTPDQIKKYIDDSDISPESGLVRTYNEALYGRDVKDHILKFVLALREYFFRIGTDAEKVRYAVDALKDLIDFFDITPADTIFYLAPKIKVNRKNNPVLAAQFVDVARSYYRYRGTQAPYSFVYGHHTCLDEGFDPNSGNEIDCSAFVGLVLRGIPFWKSPYTKVISDAGVPLTDDENSDADESGATIETDGGYYDPLKLEANKTDYSWAVNPGDYIYPMKTDGSGSKPVRTAAQLAQWMKEQGLEIEYDETFVDVEPGDIIFYAKKNADGSWVQPNRFMNISHVSICASKIYVNDYDTATTYAAGKYAVKDGYLYRSNEQTSGTFNEAKWTKIGRHRYRHGMMEVSTPVTTVLNRTLERTYADKIVMICRPDLGSMNDTDNSGNAFSLFGKTSANDIHKDGFYYLTSDITSGLPSGKTSGTGLSLEVKSTYRKNGQKYSMLQICCNTRDPQEMWVRGKYLYATDEQGNVSMKRPEQVSWTDWNAVGGSVSTESGVTSYKQLSNKPQIGGVTLEDNKTADDLGLATKTFVTQTASGFYNSLGTVATSGSYNDLEDKPKLKTVATSGSFDDLSNVPIMLKMKLSSGDSIDPETDFNTLLTPGCKHVDHLYQKVETYATCLNTPYSECTISTKESDEYLKSGGNLYIIKIGATVEKDQGEPLRYKQIFIPRKQRCGEYYMRHIEKSQKTNVVTASKWYMFLPHKKAESITLADFNI